MGNMKCSKIVKMVKQKKKTMFPSTCIFEFRKTKLLGKLSKAFSSVGYVSRYGQGRSMSKAHVELHMEFNSSYEAWMCVILY
jgi:hypothetical protein